MQGTNSALIHSFVIPVFFTKRKYGCNQASSPDSLTDATFTSTEVSVLFPVSTSDQFQETVFCPMLRYFTETARGSSQHLRTIAIFLMTQNRAGRLSFS
ncbi:unnamed protein product [Closterium sp. NIES-54]